MLLIVTFAILFMLSLVHFYTGRIGIFDAHPGIWKSVFGGVGISYTFMVLLPKLAVAQVVLDNASNEGVYGYLVHHSYLVALAGLVCYYGLDAAVENAAAESDKSSRRAKVNLLTYLHASGTAGYYFLISYLMVESYNADSPAYLSLSIFAFAMLLHYLSLDHSLRHKYRGLYDRSLRWLFVVATAGGWVAAVFTDMSYESLALLYSFFAGSIIIFSLKEKIPGSDYLRFWPFLLGVVCYSSLVLAIQLLK